MNSKKVTKQKEYKAWNTYYRRTLGRPPSPICLYAIDRFKREERHGCNAIDLGCGAGHETIVLLKAGFKVIAMDREASALKITKRYTPIRNRKQLTLKKGSFEKIKLPPADLIHSSCALPFCNPKFFSRTWKCIESSIARGGRFAGDFFGPKDDWASKPDMTFLGRREVRALFKNFKIEMFRETVKIDGTALGPEKRWHVISVVARKR